jgi:hypothetical protein
MRQECIEIRGACENNLKDVSLRLPKRKITELTGVSGSGAFSSSSRAETERIGTLAGIYERFGLAPGAFGK